MTYENHKLRFAGAAPENPIKDLRNNGLERVTLCCISSIHRGLSENALLRSCQDLNFASVLYLSDLPPLNPKIQFVQIEKISSRTQYNHFILHELHKYIKTDYVLIVQYDGFVINPTLWQKSFLDFDYIGARWSFYEEDVVGNGGFSLRSKKLLEATASPIFTNTINSEDDSICRRFRRYLEGRYGIRFGTPEIADAFSLEFVESEIPSFGFHGLHRLYRVFDREELKAAILDFSQTTLSTPPVILLFMHMYVDGVHENLGLLATRMLQYQTPELLRKNCDIFSIVPAEVQQLMLHFAGADSSKTISI